MESEKYCTLHARVVRKSDASKSQRQSQDSDKWRRQCGCIRTSEKLKELLKSFPSAPPPSPSYDQKCLAAYCSEDLPYPLVKTKESETKLTNGGYNNMESKMTQKSWQIVAELVHLVQLSVTATALALYYVIYCYMQLIYYTLSCALYFHNADGPMKITIGVVTITSVIVAFNLIIRMEKLVGIYLF